MEFTGKHSIDASPSEVWAAITDPVMLQRCLPGAQSVERVGEDAYVVVMAVAVGPLRARFQGRLRLEDVRPAQACTMVFDGEGGVVGFARGRASVLLAPQDAGTQLAYTAQADVGGKLAQVGSRLIDGVARKLSEDLFGALQRELAATPTPASVTEPVAAQDTPRARCSVNAWWLLPAGGAGAVVSWLVLLAAGRVH
jgi:carbon monoxide dehydrogenase subunit G